MGVGSRGLLLSFDGSVCVCSIFRDEALFWKGESLV